MPYFDSEKYKQEAKALSPELKALVVHHFLEAIQDYTDDVIQQKDALLQKDPSNEAQIKKRTKWLHYKEFNQIALNEIEAGTLDAWFDKL